MIHRFDARVAPRIYLVPVTAFVLIAGSIAAVVFGLVVLGVIALAVSIFADYHLIRFSVYQFRSNVEWNEERVSCRTSMGGTVHVAWEDVTLGGAYKTSRGERYLFVYAEEEDDLLTIPPHYTQIEVLEDEIRERSEKFLELGGGTADDIASALKPYVETEPSD